MGSGNSVHNLISDILVFMGDLGIRYVKDELAEIFEYVRKMIEDDRVMFIADERGLHTILFFSVCFEPEKYLKKGTWEFKEHNPEGKYFYVEKMASRSFSKKHLSEIDSLVGSLYPNVEFGRWHRYGKTGDREFTIRRKAYVEDSCIKQ